MKALDEFLNKNNIIMPHDTLKNMYMLKIFHFRNGNVIIPECYLSLF